VRIASRSRTRDWRAWRAWRASRVQRSHTASCRSSGVDTKSRATVYVTSCQAMEVTPRIYTNCTNEIPAELNGTHMFVDPISFVIKAAAAPVRYKDIAPPKVEIEWVVILHISADQDCTEPGQIPVKPTIIHDMKVMNLGLGRSFYRPTPLPGEPGDKARLPGRECRTGIQRKSSWRVGLISYGPGHREPHRRSGVPSGADVMGDRFDGRGGPADTVPGGHPEDDVEHRDPGDRDCKDKGLRMVADGSLLGHPYSGSGSSAGWTALSLHGPDRQERADRHGGSGSRSGCRARGQQGRRAPLAVRLLTRPFPDQGVFGSG
jgi:hypothetical protein